MAGRVVVVSGAAGGMGRGICRAFASREDRLVLADLDRAKLDALTAELEASGATVRPCLEDISTDDGIAAVFATADTLGPVDVLVNAVGIAGRPSVLEMAASEFDRMMAVCVPGDPILKPALEPASPVTAEPQRLC